MIISNEEQKYVLLMEKLCERCQEIQTETERLVLRINKVKKLSRRQQRDVDLLKRRLGKYNDGWRSLPMVAPHPKRKMEQKRGPKPKLKEPNEIKEKKERKQRAKKKPRMLSNDNPCPQFGTQFTDLEMFGNTQKSFSDQIEIKQESVN